MNSLQTLHNQARLAEKPLLSRINLTEDPLLARRLLASAISSLGRWARMLSENRQAVVTKDDSEIQILLGEKCAPFVIGVCFCRGFFAANEALDWVFVLPWSRIIVPPRSALTAEGEKRFFLSLEVDGDYLSRIAKQKIHGITIGFYVDGFTRKSIAEQFALDVKIFHEDDKSVSSDSYGRIPVDIKSLSKRSLKSKKKG